MKSKNFKLICVTPLIDSPFTLIPNTSKENDLCEFPSTHILIKVHDTLFSLIQKLLKSLTVCPCEQVYYTYQHLVLGIFTHGNANFMLSFTQSGQMFGIHRFLFYKVASEIASSFGFRSLIILDSSCHTNTRIEPGSGHSKGTSNLIFDLMLSKHDHPSKYANKRISRLNYSCIHVGFKTHIVKMTDDYEVCKWASVLRDGRVVGIMTPVHLVMYHLWHLDILMKDTHWCFECCFSQLSWISELFGFKFTKQILINSLRIVLPDILLKNYCIPFEVDPQTHRPVSLDNDTRMPSYGFKNPASFTDIMCAHPHTRKCHGKICFVPKVLCE